MFGFGKKRKGALGGPEARHEPLPPPARAAAPAPATSGEPTTTEPLLGATPPAPETARGGPEAASDQKSEPAPDAPAWPRRPSPLAAMNERMLGRLEAATPATGALNSQIVQAVQLTNAETAGYAPSQIATAPDMMISQASGLVAQSAAAYFDGVSKLALASQAILLKQMTENIAADKPIQAAEDALGALATDLLMGAAAAVAAAAGALEADAAGFAIDKIDQSIARYSDTLANRQAAANP